MQSVRIAAMLASLTLLLFIYQNCSRSDISSSSAPLKSNTFCYNCLSIRLGRPLVSRSAQGTELDTTFPILKLKSGKFRGFSSNATVLSLDGVEPWSMSGSATTVLRQEGESTGYWMNSVFQTGSSTIGFVHQETNFDYKVGQTFKEMDISYSSDEGLSWSTPTKIISGIDPPTKGEIVGEGDCSAVLGQDSYYYLYCQKARPAIAGIGWHTIVARAKFSDLSPQGWKKLYQGTWSAPGIAGNADSLGYIGTTAALLQTLNQVGIFGINPYVGGITLSLASDYKTFTTLKEPILPFDAANWDRPKPTDLYAYLGVTNYQEGGNQVSESFGINYIYLPPNGDFSTRYLVFQDIVITQNLKPPIVSVGVELTRWQRIDNGILRTTNAPVIENYSTYNYVKSLGYMLTTAPSVPSNKIEECWSDWSGHDDFLITNDGTCTNDGYKRLRTIGWVFQEQVSGTKPLYRCWSPIKKFHFGSNASDCEGLGQMEWLLGYVLSH